MARMYGLAVVPWSALGSGKLKSEAEVDHLFLLALGSAYILD